MFSKVKDAASAFAVKSFLNSKLNRAGEIEELIIDSKSKKIKVTLALAGESEAISVSINSYGIEHQAGGAFLEIKELNSSRRWIEMLCVEHLVGRKVQIPSAVSKLL